jgi:hypothetical protein
MFKKIKAFLVLFSFPALATPAICEADFQGNWSRTFMLSNGAVITHTPESLFFVDPQTQCSFKDTDHPFMFQQLCDAELKVNMSLQDFRLVLLKNKWQAGFTEN